MLRTVCPQRTMWEELLPAECQRLPVELERVDRLLDDRALFTPFRPFFDPEFGRPSIPLETYVRMMWLKHRYRLGYETLCREVADSLGWRRFCRIPLGESVPHPTTLAKITRRCGPAVVDQLNDMLLARAAAEKVVRLERVRADSTVVPANVRYPSDAGLLASAIAMVVMVVARVHRAGGAVRTRVRNRRRAARRRTHALGASLRRRSGDAQTEVFALTAELAELAELTVVDATRVIVNARRTITRRGRAASGRLQRAVADLDDALMVTTRVIAQTRRRLAGDMPAGHDRLVSFHDRDARPIRKGRLGKPVEFGYKGQVVDNVDGLVLDHSIHQANPPDAGLLLPAIARVANRFRRVPRAVTADRGYGQPSVDAGLHDLGVKFVAIPRAGRADTARRREQATRRFRRLVKWRTGCEGRISSLKHGYGWDRTLLVGLDGTRIWCGWGVLAHNSRRISELIHERDDRRDRRRWRSAAIDPPGDPPRNTVAA